MKIRSYDEEWTLEGLQAAMLAAREHCRKTGVETHILGNDGGFVCGFRAVRLPGQIPGDATIEQFFLANDSAVIDSTRVSHNQFDLELSFMERRLNALRKQ